MKLTLMIEGSASALAAILASLPDGVAIASAPAAPSAPMPMIPAMPANPSDDDEGPVNIAAPAVDARGLTWDERIHAKSKTTIADGSWRKRKGVDDATVAAVEAELRARSAPPMPAAAPMMQPMQPAPAPMPMPAPIPLPGGAPAAPFPAAAPIPAPAPAVMGYPAPAAMPAIEQPAPAPIPMPAPAPVAAPQPTPGVMDFSQFMQHLSMKMAERDANGAPLIHADYLANITAEISTAFNQQLSALTDIATDPNKINYAVQLLARDGRW